MSRTDTPSSPQVAELAPSDVAHWCPACHGAPLQLTAPSLGCPNCGTSYPMAKGIPVLIHDDRSVFAKADFLTPDAYEGPSYGSQDDPTAGLRGWYRRTMHRITESGPRLAGTSAQTAIERVCHEVPFPRILVIGAGQVRYAAQARFTYTDVSPSAGLSCIADAHDLPFADGAFDMVVAVAVLEHVADPQKVTHEMQRVLSDRGWVYAVTPFLQPVHMGAYDFTRFTLLGHRRLFRSFEEIDSGAAQGPGSVFGSALRSFLLSFGKSRQARRLLNLLGILLAVPFRWLDRWTLRSPAALDGAGGVYFFGRRATTSISDRELIPLYRGGF